MVSSTGEQSKQHNVLRQHQKRREYSMVRQLINLNNLLRRHDVDLLDPPQLAPLANTQQRAGALRRETIAGMREENTAVGEQPLDIDRRC